MMIMEKKWTAKKLQTQNKENYKNSQWKKINEQKAAQSKLPKYYSKKKKKGGGVGRGGR